MGGPCDSGAYQASLGVSPASLPNATVGATYNQTVTASGGTAPYGYVIAGGNLPAGLTLSAAGVLSGTPTAGGSFTFTVAVIATEPFAIVNTAIVDDGEETLELTAITIANGFKSHLPTVMKGW